jgi:threonine dehydrogenase-like Zn-dependent dehydrogenase
MAIQTRYAGDANGVVNVDNGIGSLGNIVATGLTKEPIIFKVAGVTFTAGEMATGGAVETILRSIAIDSTITMYQVDSGQISVYLEATGAQSGESVSSTSEGAYIQTTAQIASAMQTRLQALNAGGNIGIAGTVTAGSLTVTTNNFKLA